MNISKNIHTFIGCDSDYAESRIAIFGAPFDSTTSYRPGARFASSAMRNEAMELKPTVHIRIRIYLTLKFLIAAILSFVSGVLKARLTI